MRCEERLKIVRSEIDELWDIVHPENEYDMNVFSWIIYQFKNRKHFKRMEKLKRHQDRLLSKIKDLYFYENNIKKIPDAKIMKHKYDGIQKADR